MELPNGNLRIVVSGTKRVKIVEYVNEIADGDILKAHTMEIDLPKFDEVEEIFTDEAIKMVSDCPFKGNIDLVKLAKNGVEFVIIRVGFGVNYDSIGYVYEKRLTPIGNPQNIYIFSISELSLTDFILIMLPYSVVSLAVLLVISFFIKKQRF